jgi:hypothetical protein
VGQHSRLQLFTVEQLLDGRQVDYPHPSGTNVTHKRAPKAKAPVPENLNMFAMAAEEPEEPFGDGTT